MAQSPTVLILGAGASAPYGFPIGRGLIEQVEDLARSLADPKGPAISPHLAKLQPLFSATGFTSEDAAAFHGDLVASQCASIDSFLEYQSGRTQQVGKLLIAAAIAFCEKWDQLLRPRTPSGERIASWYEEVFERVHRRLHANDPMGLVFVTFNYDRSLETLLQRALTARGLPSGEAKARIDNAPILHVHGRLASREYGSPPEDLSTLGSKIQIITDDISDTEPVLRRARKLIGAAPRLVFLGFGYDRRNLERILPSDYRGTAVGTAVGLGEKRRIQVAQFFQGREVPFQMLPAEDDIITLLRKIDILEEM
jgi:hypothetical protein